MTRPTTLFVSSFLVLAHYGAKACSFRALPSTPLILPSFLCLKVDTYVLPKYPKTYFWCFDHILHVEATRNSSTSYLCMCEPLGHRRQGFRRTSTKGAAEYIANTTQLGVGTEKAEKHNNQSVREHTLTHISWRRGEGSQRG